MPYVIAGNNQDEFNSLHKKLGNHKVGESTLQDQAQLLESLLKKDARVYQSHLQAHFDTELNNASQFDQHL